MQPVQKPTAPPPTQSSDLFAPVHDFFASGVWTYVRNGAIFLAAVLWLGSVVWTLKDARRRIADPVLVLVAGIVGAVPVLGTLVYLLVRPPEYLDDVAERRLEIDALEAELAAARLRCGSCEARIQPDQVPPGAPGERGRDARQARGRRAHVTASRTSSNGVRCAYSK